MTIEQDEKQYLREQNAKSVARYRQKQPERLLASNRAYRKKWPEKIRAWGRISRLRHKEKRNAYARNYERVKYAEFRAFVDSLKALPCTDCKQEFVPCVMDFDHVRGEKKFEIGKGSLVTRVVLLHELAKCDLVCANCHRIRTNNLRYKNDNSG